MSHVYCALCGCRRPHDEPTTDYCCQSCLRLFPTSVWALGQWLAGFKMTTTLVQFEEALTNFYKGGRR